MKAKKTKKKLLIAAISLVLVAALGIGIWAVSANRNSDPVLVFEFMHVGMTEYWGDSQESYGPVTTDRIQTVYLTDTQTVTEILVSQGDTVQKGDVLLRFDTTLSDLALERKRLDVEKLKLQLQNAQKELREINGMKPMVIPQETPEEDPDEDKGLALEGNFQISTDSDFDGSSQEKALICWLHSAATVDDALLETLRQKANEYQTINAEQEDMEASSASPVDGETDPSEDPSDPSEDPSDPSEDPSDPSEDPSETPSEDPSDPSEDPSETPSEDPSETPSEDPSETPSEDPSDPSEDPSDPSEDPSEPSEEPEVKPVDTDRYYVVFKVTEGNMSLGSRLTWQGLQVIRDDASGFRFRFFTPAISDHMLTEEENEGIKEPEIDFGSGFTAAQIAEMRVQKQKEIKDLEFQIKMAEADYKIMQTEVSDGAVRATVDGEVVSLLSEEEAKMTQQPLLKVSGGGGFYVEGSVSELEKDKMVIGQEVTVNDWNTGMTYTGTVESIGDFPNNEDYYNGMNNPNASYYPFTVFVDGSADLQAGRYVSVMYSAGTSEHGIYLQNPFLRTEQGRSYVYVRGEDGKLEQRFVTTGKSLWGSYMEILSGLSEEDYIAFPYGKNIGPGAPTREGDLSELYG